MHGSPENFRFHGRGLAKKRPLGLFVCGAGMNQTNHEAQGKKRPALRFDTSGLCTAGVRPAPGDGNPAP